MAFFDKRNTSAAGAAIARMQAGVLTPQQQADKQRLDAAMHEKFMQERLGPDLAPFDPGPAALPSAGGQGGGGPVAYMPGGAPIGKGMPKAWSGPQGNFEAAKARGEVTPAKVAQAQAFAAAHGRTFDPSLGYSTNAQAQPQPKTPAATPAPATMPAVGVPKTPAPTATPTPAAKPAAAVPGFMAARPTVTDFNGQPWQTSKQKDAVYYANGPQPTPRVPKVSMGGSLPPPQPPKRGAAAGTPAKGVPVKALKGRAFWVGEAGPEIAQIKDGKLTVVPNHAIKAAGVQPPAPDEVLSLAMEAKGRGFAGGTAWQTDSLRSVGNVFDQVALPSTPDTAFPSTRDYGTPPPAPVMPAVPPASMPVAAPAADNAPVKAFVPTFAPSLTAPAGVRKTDFRRFMRSPQGMQFALQHEAGQQADAAHAQNHAAWMTTQRGWQQEDAKARKDEVAQAIADEVAGQRAAHASLGGTLDPITELALSKMKPAAQAEFFKHAITATARRQQEEDAAKRQAEEEARRSVDHVTMMQAPDGSGFVPMTVDKQGRARAAGGFMPTKIGPQGQAGIMMVPLPGTSHAVPYYNDGTGLKPVAGGHLYEGNAKDGWKLKERDQLPLPVKQADGTLRMFDRRTGQPLPGGVVSPSDADKLAWMQSAGYKPDASGAYTPDQWATAWHALQPGAATTATGGAVAVPGAATTPAAPVTPSGALEALKASRRSAGMGQ